MAQPVLHDREHILVVLGLDEEQRRGIETCLLQSRRIKVEACKSPQHTAPAACRRSCGNANGEERSRSIVGQRRCRRRHFV